MLMSSFASPIRIRAAGNSEDCLKGGRSLRLLLKPPRTANCKRSLREISPATDAPGRARSEYCGRSRIATAGRAHLGRVGEGGVAVRHQVDPPGRGHSRRGPFVGNGRPSISRDGGVAGFAAVPGGPLPTEGHPAGVVRFIRSRGAPRALRATTRASQTKPFPGARRERTAALMPTNAGLANAMCDFPLAGDPVRRIANHRRPMNEISPWIVCEK